MVIELLFAVHISDGVLAPGFQAAGFVVCALLAWYGAFRISDEEIPRVAILTSAYFAASFMHVSIAGISSVHLLLNGLMGVVLGRRAALAIPAGVALQALLLQHGGYATIGVNAVVMTIPALIAWQIFRLIGRRSWSNHSPMRMALVFLSVAGWLLCVVYGVVLIATNFRSSLSMFDLKPSNAVLVHPGTWLIVLPITALITWAERRFVNTPEFPIGLLIGAVAVLLTVLFNAFVLVFGAQETLPFLVLVTIVPHVCIAAVEGVILGFTVGFMARVKPELLGWSADRNNSCRRSLALTLDASEPAKPLPHPRSNEKRVGQISVPALIAGIVAMLAPGTAHAHKLEAEFRVLPNKQIKVEAWYDITDVPARDAKVRVYQGEWLVTEGSLDAEGTWVFPYDAISALRIVIDAGAGHRAELRIPTAALTSASNAEAVSQDRHKAHAPSVGMTELIVAIAFIVAVAALVLSIRTAREVAAMRKRP